MIRALCSLFLLGTTAWAGLDPLAVEVDRFLATTRFQEHGGPALQSPLIAAADGGILGVVGPRVHAWFPEIDGFLRDGNERVDFQSDLALDDMELSIFPQLDLNLGLVNLRLDAFFLESEGRNTITRTFEFGGITFAANEDVSSRVEINFYRLGTVFRVIHTDNITIAAQGGIALLSLEGEVVGSTLGRGEEDADVPVPLVGALVQLRVSRFLFEADVSGMAISYDDISGEILDIRVSVGVTVFKLVAVRVGYRHLMLNGEADDFEVDAELSGFFVGASLQF